MAKESTKSREERAKSSTSPEELEKFAQDKEMSVRQEVADNANTPVSVLEKLAEDQHWDVRFFVAKNPNTPDSVLEKLAEDQEDWEGIYVRQEVAENPNTPVSVLEKLAGDENEDVRKAAEENQNMSASALEKKTVVDDKAKALLVESLKKTAEKINKWISDSETTLALGAAAYTVWEKERENGTFTVKKNGKSEEIEGYIMWGNKSSVILKWWLPDSASAAIETLEKDEWSDREIEYDDNEWSGSSEGKSSVAFDANDNTIENYGDFEGGGDIQVVDFGSIYGPSSLTITYENDQEVVFESSGGDSWTVKIADGQPEKIADYQAVLEVTRILLNCQQ